ncbi:MAG: tetratricopeptide repeat protein [Desulfobulbaceae bacterium]|nr:tetratricopeptide repeat protein [Desulfobulbaceae bacterium]
MNEIKMQEEQNQETGSEAQQDYEAGQEFLKNGDVAQAANAFHNALIGFERENNENGIANASDKLIDICGDRGETEKALKHLERAYAICSKHSDRFSLFSLERKKAGLIHQSGNLDQAIAHYLDILDEYSALHNPQGSVETLETLADIYLKKGEKAKAADAYRLAASIHQSFKHKQHAEEFLVKATAAEARGEAS